ncbi:twin-arginine translocase subunit TatC [Candidatus Calescamantes bacterium]|nr:twin-arginine translocase subunit TatC [Candidatus Calescamantes bacterium]
MKESFLDHLEELRKRIIHWFVFCCIATLLTFYFSPKIIEHFFIHIHHKVPFLILLKPTESLFTRIKISLFIGFLSSLPFLLLQVWEFVSPGLFPSERKFFSFFLFFSLFLFSAGLLFSWKILLPWSLNFLTSLLTTHQCPLYSLNAYISFSLFLLLATGIAFEFPLIIYALVRLSIIEVNTLRKFQKHAIVLSFILSAVITPPDPFTQILVALPLIILYEISLLFCLLISRKHQVLKKKGKLVE